jgi:hypothetical protein
VEPPKLNLKRWRNTSLDADDVGDRSSLKVIRIDGVGIESRFTVEMVEAFKPYRHRVLSLGPAACGGAWAS